MKKKIIFLIIFYISAIAVFAQPYQVGHKQKTFIDPSRSNRNITTEIYYPSNTAGNNVPLAPGQFPLLVFGHGFVMAWSAYADVWNALVPQGYFLVFPTTETSFSPSHLDFGKDIAFLVGAMKAESANSTSFYSGAVAPQSAVMGHSMGGGSAFLSVQYDTSITVLATLAAAVTNPSSILAAEGITIPSLVIAGANDCVAPPAQHQIPMYDSLSSICKTYVSVTGGSHCQFADYNLYCSIGEGSCSPQATITRAQQQATTFSLLLPWLNYFLKGSLEAGIQFQTLISAGAGITSQQNCSLVNTGTTEKPVDVAISVKPNPFSSSAIIETSLKLNDAILLIYNALGQKVKQINAVGGSEILFYRENLPAGIYFIILIQNNQQMASGKMAISN